MRVSSLPLREGEERGEGGEEGEGKRERGESGSYLTTKSCTLNLTRGTSLTTVPVGLVFQSSCSS